MIILAMMLSQYSGHLVSHTHGTYMQELRASQVEDADLQEAIARSLQESKQGEPQHPCCLLREHCSFNDVTRSTLTHKCALNQLPCCCHLYSAPQSLFYM